MVQTSQEKVNDYYFYVIITLWILLAAFFFGRYGYEEWNLQETILPQIKGPVGDATGVVYSKILYILILSGLLISILTFSVLLYLELNNTLV